MRSITRDVLTREVIDWHQQGLINRSLLDALLPRYETHGRFLAALLKWLGLFALFQLGLAVLAFIAMMTESAGVAALLLALVGAGLWFWGVQMATDPQQRHPFTGAVLVTASLAAAFGVLLLLYLAAGGDSEDRAIPILMLLTGVLARSDRLPLSPALAAVAGVAAVFPRPRRVARLRWAWRIFRPHSGRTPDGGHRAGGHSSGSLA